VRGHVCRCGRCCIRQSCRARSRPILLAYVSIISATFTSQGNAAILHVVCGAVNRATGSTTAHGLSCSLGATDAVASGVHAGGHRWLPSAVCAPHRTLPTIVKAAPAADAPLIPPRPLKILHRPRHRPRSQPLLARWAPRRSCAELPEAMPPAAPSSTDVASQRRPSVAICVFPNLEEFSISIAQVRLWLEALFMAFLVAANRLSVAATPLSVLVPPLHQRMSLAP
jgi:hypothetical protein